MQQCHNSKNPTLAQILNAGAAALTHRKAAIVLLTAAVGPGNCFGTVVFVAVAVFQWQWLLRNMRSRSALATAADSTAAASAAALHYSFDRVLCGTWRTLIRCVVLGKQRVSCGTIARTPLCSPIALACTSGARRASGRILNAAHSARPDHLYPRASCVMLTT